MAWEDLKQSITDVIYTNSVNAITGDGLQGELHRICDALGENATYAGVAVPATNPGTPDGTVYYFASEMGTYTHFSGIVINQPDKLYTFSWNGTSWDSEFIFTGGADIDNFLTPYSIAAAQSGNTYANFEQRTDTWLNWQGSNAATRSSIGDNRAKNRSLSYHRQTKEEVNFVFGGGPAGRDGFIRVILDGVSYDVAVSSGETSDTYLLSLTAVPYVGWVALATLSERTITYRKLTPGEGSVDLIPHAGFGNFGFTREQVVVGEDAIITEKYTSTEETTSEWTSDNNWRNITTDDQLEILNSKTTNNSYSEVSNESFIKFQDDSWFVPNSSGSGYKSSVNLALFETEYDSNINGLDVVVSNGWITVNGDWTTTTVVGVPMIRAQHDVNEYATVAIFFEGDPDGVLFRVNYSVGAYYDFKNLKRGWNFKSLPQPGSLEVRYSGESFTNRTINDKFYVHYEQGDFSQSHEGVYGWGKAGTTLAAETKTLIANRPVFFRKGEALYVSAGISGRVYSAESSGISESKSADHVFSVNDKDGNSVLSVDRLGYTSLKNVDIEASKRKIDSLIDDKIVLWGDSLTIDIAPVLQGYLSGIDCVNAATGGENVFDIACRQGGIPLRLENQTVLLGDGFRVAVGVIDSDNEIDGLVVWWNDSTIRVKQFLAQGDQDTINPCYVDGIKCHLIRVSPGVFYLNRLDVGEDRILLPGTIIETAATRNLRNAMCTIMNVGQNGGYTSIQDLINIYDAMIDNLKTKDYIIIGLHAGTTQLGGTVTTAQVNDALEKRYGSRFINFYKYATEPVSINYGAGNVTTTMALHDAGITTPTSSPYTANYGSGDISFDGDATDISNGRMPSSLRRDDTHLNRLGDIVISELIVKKLKALGYVE